MPATPTPQSSYDRVLYPSGVFSQTHPDRLATHGYLRGLATSPIDRCRVLELGCGSGTNLIAMAAQLPHSEFVGLDAAESPITAGRQLAQDLALTNLSLKQLNLQEADFARLGGFDYIITHGVFSWVPEEVRNSILRVSRDLLNPHGVAYVSYNAYPGNHFRDLVRGMMRFHVADLTEPSDQIGQGRGLLKFLAESQSQPDYYAAAIEAEFQRTLKYTDEAFYHDDLSAVNRPFYFYEFMAEAAQFGLQYVGEADPNELSLNKFTPATAARWQELSSANELVREQFKDFLRACGFRQTLLCRAELTVAPDLLPERVPNLYAACDAAPVAEGETGNEAFCFRQADGTEIGTPRRSVADALHLLCAAYPQPVRFSTLADALRENTDAGLAENEAQAELAAVLLRCYKLGFCRLGTWAYDVTNRISSRPAVSKLARTLVSRGLSAVSQLHVGVKFPDPVSRRLIVLLDGTRTVGQVIEELIAFVRAGHGVVYEDGKVVKDPRGQAALLEHRVHAGLQTLLRSALLVA